MLQRVSLQYWQKLQSGQGFFLRRIIFPIFYINLFSCLMVNVMPAEMKLTPESEIL